MKKIILTIALLLSTSVFADTAICTGKINNVANHAPGAVYVRIAGFSLIKICSLEATQFRTTPENCKHMAALAAQAYAQNETVTIYIDNALTTNCSDIPNWFTADVRYFSMKK